MSNMIKFCQWKLLVFKNTRRARKICEATNGEHRWSSRTTKKVGNHVLPDTRQCIECGTKEQATVTVKWKAI